MEQTVRGLKFAVGFEDGDSLKKPRRAGHPKI
jgi:hypothetical protein